MTEHRTGRVPWWRGLWSDLFRSSVEVGSAVSRGADRSFGVDGQRPGQPDRYRR